MNSLRPLFSLTLFVSFGLFIAPPVRILNGDEISYLGEGGLEVRTKSGTISGWEEDRYIMALPDGGTFRVATNRVKEITIDWPEPFSNGMQEARLGNHSAATPLMLQGLQKEKVAWRQMEMLGALVESAYAAGQYETACTAYLELNQKWPGHRFSDKIPLAWISAHRDGRVEQLSENWKSSNDSTAKLLAASWTLTGAGRAKAIDLLKILSTDSNPMVKALAKAQLWRSELVVAKGTDVSMWESATRTMPAEWQAGPLYLIARVKERLGDKTGALFAFLEVGTLHQDQHALASECLLAAAKLTRGEHPEEARKLYSEIIQRFPQSDPASLARDELKNLEGN